MLENPPYGDEAKDDPPIYLSAVEAAARLEVSASGLRRLADIYAEVYAPLERDPKTNGRLWTLSAVERLGAARALLRAGKAGSIRDALLALQRGAETGTEIAAEALRPMTADGALRDLVRRLEQLEQANQELHMDNQGLKDRLDELLVMNRQVLRQLEAPKEDAPPLRERRRPWWRFWRR